VIAEEDPEGLRSTASNPDAARHVIDAVHAFFQGRSAPAGVLNSLGDVLGAQESPPSDLRAKPDLSKGEPWGPLIVLEWIGGGSFGDVFQAWDPTLAKEVALKLSRHSSTSDADRAVLEAQRLASIPPHPNVITVYGAHKEGGVVGIWMEFLRGRTLQRVVKDEGALGWVEATHYGDCLCRALSHVHGALVLHRDLKAANVMKAAGGRIVLIDFGAGEEIAPAGAPAPDRLVGTLPYMAPELFEGRPATPQTDIYSLGVLLFNLVTGTYPVTGRTREDFENAHRAGRRTLLSDVRADLPMSFVRVVEDAIDPNSSRRYRTAGEFLRALGQQVAPGPAPRPSVDTWSTRILWALLILVGGFTGIGLFTSRWYDMALERSGFSPDTVTKYFTLGWQASVKPAFIAVVAFASMQLLVNGKRLACAMFPRVRRFDAACRRLLSRAARRTRLDDPSVLAASLLALSIAVLGATWWSFSDLLGAVFTTRISTATNKTLAILAPASYANHQWYREVATYVAVGLAVAWYYMARYMARTSGSLKNGLLVGGLLVVLVSIASLNAPYRLLVRPQEEAVHWRDAKGEDYDCYIIGESSSERLLFCPTRAERIPHISKSEKVEPFGPAQNNIFEKFGSRVRQ
jgi:hypothetical protein